MTQAIVGRHDSQTDEFDERPTPIPRPPIEDPPEPGPDSPEPELPDTIPGGPDPSPIDVRLASPGRRRVIRAT